MINISELISIGEMMTYTYRPLVASGSTQTGVMNMNGVVNQMNDLLITYGLKILAAIIILIAGRYVARLCRRLTENLLTRARQDRTVVLFVGNMAFFLVIVFAVIAALAKLGIQTASFIAVLGAAGVAIGLALQGSLSNFASGVLILIFRPFKVGDTVESAGVSGEVVEIQIFSTILMSQDNIRIIVPNNKLYTDIIKVRVR